jgi:LmbE family N-acetylglucosaminyl deacetylase
LQIDAIHNTTPETVKKDAMIGFNIKNLLVLSAHTDDEQACSGTIAKATQAGVAVHHVIFSACEESVPAGFPIDVLRGEAQSSARVLGIQEENLRILNYRVRYFPTFRQEILEDLIKIRNEIKPDLVLLPSRSDIHQDHKTICEEGIRAFKFSSILGYELPMNHFGFSNQCYVSLDQALMDIKIQAIKCYKSQEFRTYMTEAHFESLAKLRGTQAGFDYAEAFEVIRIRS